VTEFFLALDQGSHASRAIAFTPTGELLDREQIAIETLNPRPGWYEHDAETLLASVVSAIDGLFSRQPSAACLGAGLATQRSSIVCWDRVSGAPLSPVVSWRDTRNADWLAQLPLDPDRLHWITGLRISAHYGASKLRWCLDHLPAVSAARQQGRLAWGPLASFLIFRLTRERTLAADPANGSRTLLWDLHRRAWSDELLECFGLDRAALPESVAEDHAFGHLTVGADAIPLLRCTGDQSAALHARGLPALDTAYINAGTGAFVLRPLARADDADGLLNSVIRGDAADLALAREGTVNGAATALDAEAGALDADGWIERLAGVRHDDTGVPVFLNGHAGLGSPWWRASFPCRYIGEGDTDDRLRAVLESIVFMLAENLRRCAQDGTPMERIIASGGLSRMPLFCSTLAKVSGLEVQRPEVAEATARGLAWMCSGAVAPWPDHGEMHRYAPAAAPGLDARYRRWQAEMTRAIASLPV